MNPRMLAIAALGAAVFPLTALAGALDECRRAGSDSMAVARCLMDADLATLSALQQAEDAAAKSAREVEATTGRLGAHTALVKASRAFALYQRAQCEYVAATVAAGADGELAKIACRIDVARGRIAILR